MSTDPIIYGIEHHTRPERRYRTYLVAIVADSQQGMIDALVEAQLTDPDFHPGTDIDSWWIAEDDRLDGSDNDSAVFCPRGAQRDISNLIKTWAEANHDRWSEEGYPYPDDVSGVWFP